jgi:hypothetical protein
MTPEQVRQVLNPGPNLTRYEQEKAKIQNLLLTPAQYQKAIAKLARECGV